MTNPNTQEDAERPERNSDGESRSDDSERSAKGEVGAKEDVEREESGDEDCGRSHCERKERLASRGSHRRRGKVTLLTHT